MANTTKNLISTAALVIVIVTTLARFMWLIDAKSATGDEKLDLRVDKIAIVQAKILTRLDYIVEDMVEQKGISKQILAEVRQ